MSGSLIALEGIDGTGTSSQAVALVEWLRSRGRDALLTAEPSAGEIGSLIREALSFRSHFEPSTLALLFAADRLDHLVREIEPAVEDGLVVVTDRYLYSSLAYQSVDNDPAWVQAINSRARPADLVILLDAPVEVCLNRVRARDGLLWEIYERADFLAEVQKRYLELARQGSARGESVEVIDSAEPLDRVRERVIEAAARFLG